MDIYELSEAMDALRSDDVTFYVHLTEIDKGDKINDNGIILEENRLFSAVNPLEESFYLDPEGYVTNKLGSPQTRNKDLMVIVASMIGEENTLVKKHENMYVIPKENIVGYLNLHNNTFTNNENSEYDINSYTL